MQQNICIENPRKGNMMVILGRIRIGSSYINQSVTGERTHGK